MGDLKPFQMHRDLYSDATGHQGESASGFELTAPAWLYVVRNLLGSIGWLSLTPLMIPCLLGAGRLARGGAWAGYARVTLALTAGVALLYTLVYPQAVGYSYGMRHFAPLMAPLVTLGAVAAHGVWPRLRRPIVILGILSVILAGGGVLIPTTGAGFVTDERALFPARVFGSAVEEGVLPRLDRLRR